MKKYFRKIESPHPLADLQVDIAEMNKMFNRGAKSSIRFRYVLVVVDVFSRNVWLEILKSKDMYDTTDGMRKILKRIANENKGRNYKVERILSDEGPEFLNTEFRGLLNRRNIQMLNAQPGKEGKKYIKNATGVVERFIRTFKLKMNKYLEHSDERFNYNEIIQEIAKMHNERVHATTKTDPKYSLKTGSQFSDVGTFKQKQQKKVKDMVIKEGEIVSKVIARKEFTKGHIPNWTDFIYRVENRLNQNQYQISRNGKMQERKYPRWKLRVKPGNKAGVESGPKKNVKQNNVIVSITGDIKKRMSRSPVQSPPSPPPQEYKEERDYEYKEEREFKEPPPPPPKKRRNRLATKAKKREEINQGGLRRSKRLAEKPKVDYYPPKRKQKSKPKKDEFYRQSQKFRPSKKRTRKSRIKK